IRRRHPPEAIIFDDAHVAESMMRDAFTLRIEAEKHPYLLRDIVTLYQPHFEDLGQAVEFQEALSPDREGGKILMAMPNGTRAVGSRLSHLLEQHRAYSDDALKYSYAHLKDRLAHCAVFFTRGACEITPPFLPSLALDVFERNIRRVYLSATLNFKTDIIRAFGREPKLVVEPQNDAGNGERLILFSRKVAGEQFTVPQLQQMTLTRKALIAVPTYKAALAWAPVAQPPKRAEFSESLGEFRRADKGAFVLVSRVDGIDLPHDTCRLMVLDGLPITGSLLERYQWEWLGMQNLFATRLASRVVQLFGRINRGRNDFGAYLVNGRPLNSLLNSDRFVSLLPELLRKQILLGRYVQDQMKVNTAEAVDRTVEASLSRNASWIDFYGRYLSASELDRDAVARTEGAEARLNAAAKAEAAYAKAIWEGDLIAARCALDETIEETSRADTLLAGWHSVWLAACYEAEGDTESASVNFRRARNRLGVRVRVPALPGATAVGGVEPLSPFAAAVDRIVGLTSEATYRKELANLRARVRGLDGDKPHVMEEAVRSLGEMLGFEATRPDNDNDTGPDVLWASARTGQCIAFELKTDKAAKAVYSKRDVGQAHNSVQWIAENKSELRMLGFLFVGPEGTFGTDASPSPQMHLMTPSTLAFLRDELVALIEDMRRRLPIERRAAVSGACANSSWSLERLLIRFLS
ncbi:MAG: hypothetical protein ACRYG8_03530, partial [Janthinobacterium lividum]